MNADGSNQKCLTSIKSRDFVSWSINNQQIAFSGQPDGVVNDWEIYVIDVNNPVSISQLTKNNTDDRAPAWSPDGKKIAFVSYKYPQKAQIVQVAPDIYYESPQKERNLCIINPDGTNMENICGFRNGKTHHCYTHVGGGFLSLEWPLYWLPDSKRIVLQIDTAEICPKCNKPKAAIGIADGEHKKVIPLINDQKCEWLSSVSSDGKIALRAGARYIEIENKKLKETPLLKKYGWMMSPALIYAALSPDGKKIAFCGKFTGKRIKSTGCLGEVVVNAASIIYILDRETRFTSEVIKKITSRNKHIECILPAWSPVK